MKLFMKSYLVNNHLQRLLIVIAIMITAACATESHVAINPVVVPTLSSAYSGEKQTLVVGKFQNSSTYMNGIFASGGDRLGDQSKTILKAHLKNTGRFTMVDRQNMEALKVESGYTNTQQRIQGANFVVTGNVTEFGRKVQGDHQLFGILGSSKKQIAYAKVTLNIVDVTTSKIVLSTQGAGEYSLSSREIIGFGGTSGYDSTLNGKVLNLAIVEAVNRLVEGINNNLM